MAEGLEFLNLVDNPQSFQGLLLADISVGYLHCNLHSTLNAKYMVQNLDSHFQLWVS